MLLLNQAGTVPVQGLHGAPSGNKDYAHGVQAEQVRLLYGLAPASVFAGLLAGLVVALALQTVAPYRLVTLWVVALFAATLVRSFLVRAYQRTRTPDSTPVAEAASWLRRYCLTCAATGTVWGAGGLMLAAYGGLVHRLFLVLILAAVLAGALSTMIAAPRAFAAFLVPAVLPSAAWLLLQGDALAAGLGAALLLAALLFGLSARRLNRQLLYSLTLAVQNAALVGDLTAAKERLETANRDLTREVGERRRAEERLAEREGYLRTIINAEPECVVLLAPDAIVTDINPAGLALLETGDAHAVLDRDFFEFVPEPGRSQLRALLARVCDGEAERLQELEIRGLRGGMRRAELHAVALRDTRGGLRALLCVVRDITERRRRAEEALHREKERVQVTLESIGDGVITTGVDGTIEYLNPVAEQMTGWVTEQALGRPLLQVLNLVDEAARTSVQDPVLRCLQEGRTVCLAAPALLLHRHEDREFAVKVTAAPLRAREREVIGAVLVFHDVTELRTLARQMSFQASHDVLTRLINRREFETRLEQALASARASGRVHALCFLDLDRFKLVNDSCGHEAGDELLRQLAARLKAGMRERDTLARLGGDEFGVLLLDCPLEKAHGLAESLLGAVRRFRFSWGRQSFEVGASIGLVSVDGHRGSLAEVMSAADSACYLAKEEGRNRVQVFREGDADRSRRNGEMQWAHRIRRALVENRFRLHFQPIQRLDGGDGQVRNGELLLRMVDEDGHFVPPRVFLPAAERYGLMADIDNWVVDAACTALDERHPMLHGLHTCNINLSAQSLGEASFLAGVERRLHGAREAAGTLCFEIAETAAIANLSHAMGFISELRGLGCRFALDDFGAGLSSFGYLKSLPVDYIKIDGGFVKDMLSDPVDHAMVDAINRVGHVLGVQTIAEFVENDRTLACVRAVGVDFAQGYGVGVPHVLTV